MSKLDKLEAETSHWFNEMQESIERMEQDLVEWEQLRVELTERIRAVSELDELKEILIEILNRVL